MNLTDVVLARLVLSVENLKAKGRVVGLTNIDTGECWDCPEWVIVKDALSRAKVMLSYVPRDAEWELMEDEMKL